MHLNNFSSKFDKFEQILNMNMI